MSAFLLKLEKEIGRYIKLMEDARQVILDNEVSTMPIFVFSRQPVELGVELTNPLASRSDWYVYASTLENFATKGLISADKLHEFINTYRERNQHYCIFGIEDENRSSFVFIEEKSHLRTNN